MLSFEHSFEGKFFKLTLGVYQRECLLWFEIFDCNQVYFKSFGCQFHKSRIDELLDAMQGRDKLDDIRPFHFGKANKSYLLFTGNGILIGQVINPKTGLKEEFQVTGLSGLAVYDYIQLQLENSINS